MNVSTELFATTVAGYQVCRTWVSAGSRSGIQRKGMRLNSELVNNYRVVLTRLQNRLSIQAEIDRVLEAHGGWSNAFGGGFSI